MAFIEVAIGEAVQKEAMPEGSYNLVVTEAKPYHNDNSGKDSIECSIGFEDHIEAANIKHFIALPHESDEAEKRNNKLLGLKKFLEKFGVPFEDTGLNIEDINGARARIFVEQETDEEYGPQNKITYKKTS